MLDTVKAIEAAAVLISGDKNPADVNARKLIVEWSMFRGRDSGALVHIGNKPLGSISEAWRTSIYRKAKSALERHCKATGATLPLFDSEVKPAKKRAYKSKREAVQMPNDGDWNHPEDLPF